MSSRGSPIDARDDLRSRTRNSEDEERPWHMIVPRTYHRRSIARRAFLAVLGGVAA